MYNEDTNHTTDNFPAPPPLPYRNTPGITDTFILYVLTCIILLVFGSLLQELNLLGGLLITELVLVIGPPILYTLWYRYPFTQTFHITPISIKTVVLTIITTGAAFVLAGLVALLQGVILPQSQEYQEIWIEALRQLHQLPFPVTVAVIALLPGICEELLFRGFLLRGVRGKYSDSVSIIVVGGLFGIFHFDVYRFVPVTLLGILFGYMVVRTGSIFTGMVAHMTNNAIAISISYVVLRLQEQGGDAFSSSPDFESMPRETFIFGGIFLLFVVAGALIIFILGLRALPRVPDSAHGAAMKN